MEFMCREMEQIYNEGFEVGEKLGIEKGELKKAKEIALSLAQSEFPINKIAQIVQINIDVVQKWQEIDLLLCYRICPANCLIVGNKPI